MVGGEREKSWRNMRRKKKRKKITAYVAIGEIAGGLGLGGTEL